MTDEVDRLIRALDRVESERAVERLICSYGHVLDFGTVDAYADLFAPDGSIEIQSGFTNNFGLDLSLPYEKEGLASGGRRTERGVIFSGRDALKRFVAKIADACRNLHVVSQPLVTVLGDDRAEAFSYLRLYGQDVGAPPVLQGFGRYIDRFARLDGSWLFQTRICEI